MDDARSRLLFNLELSRQFWFALAVSPETAARVALRADAQQMAESAECEWVLHDVSAEALRDLGPVLLANRRPCLQWVVADGTTDSPEAWERAAASLLLYMNERRDAFRRHVAGGLVIEGRPRLKALLRNAAPDLFSIARFCLEPTPLAVLPTALPDLDERVPTEETARGELGLAQGGYDARYGLEQFARMAELDGEGPRRSGLAGLERAVEALLNQGWVGEAEPYVSQLRTLAYAGASCQPEDQWWLALVGRAEEYQGRVSEALGDQSAALASFEACRWIRSQCTQSAAQLDLARTHAMIGAVHWRLGQPEPALTALEQAAAAQRSAVSARPGHRESRTELAKTLSRMGEILLNQDRLERAGDHLREALVIRTELAEAYPGPRSWRHLSIAWSRIARLHSAQGSPSDVAQRRALDLAERVAEQDPGNVTWQLDLAMVLVQWADGLLQAGDLDGAEHANRRALLIRQRYSGEDPENARWQGWLAGSHQRLAQLRVLRGEAPGHHLEAAERLLSALVKLDPSHSGWAQQLAELEPLR